MSTIRKIYIENIKGKDKWTIPFVNFNPNKPNIVVAPNGFGKSTLTTAFKASAHGKIKLQVEDYYKKDKNNHPKLEIEISGNHGGVYTSTDTSSGISNEISIYVINSSLYAYARKSKINGNTIVSSDLRINDIIIYENIPPKIELNYKYSEIKSFFGRKGKLFLNINDFILNNLPKILDVEIELKKCISQVRIKNELINFLNSINDQGTIENIKNSIQNSSIRKLNNFPAIFTVINKIATLPNKPSGWVDVDKYFTLIQLCTFFEKKHSANVKSVIKKIIEYNEFIKLRQIIDERLEYFNTTGRDLKTIVSGKQLIVKFDRAQSMSNGERDVLSFVVEITKAELEMKKDVGILIIDEIFDYLDGSNMLAVQYYLSTMISNMKKIGKEIYPILFTHLDPNVFSNYYFKDYKVHYISAKGRIDLNCEIVKMLRLRENMDSTDENKINMERYYLHFSNNTYTFPEDIRINISSNFNDDNVTYREKLYSEVCDKYLKGFSYNPVMVLAALRIKIEEWLYNNLPDLTEQLESIHKVFNKLNFAVEHDVDVPEIFYLLQPLYNDAMHLSGNDYIVENKIKSAYLKTDNLHVKKLIRKVFEY